MHATCKCCKQLEEISEYVEAHHNAYHPEFAGILPLPATLLDAIKELVEEWEALDMSGFRYAMNHFPRNVDHPDFREHVIAWWETFGI